MTEKWTYHLNISGMSYFRAYVKNRTLAADNACKLNSLPISYQSTRIVAKIKNRTWIENESLDLQGFFEVENRVRWSVRYRVR